MRSKYHSIKTIVDGITFHSKKEAERYIDLKLLHRAGKVKRVNLQVEFELVPKQKGERSVVYIADFEVEYPDGHIEYEDVKGMKTKDYIIKRKLMLWIHEIRIKEV